MIINDIIHTYIIYMYIKYNSQIWLRLILCCFDSMISCLLFIDIYIYIQKKMDFFACHGFPKGLWWRGSGSCGDGRGTPMAPVDMGVPKMVGLTQQTHGVNSY